MRTILHCPPFGEAHQDTVYMPSSINRARAAPAILFEPQLFIITDSFSPLMMTDNPAYFLIDFQSNTLYHTAIKYQR
jgi:hypothetical protein